MAMLMTMIMMLMMKDNNTDAIPSCKSVRSGYSGFGLPIDPCHCRDLFFTTIIVVIINIHLYHIDIMILFSPPPSPWCEQWQTRQHPPVVDHIHKRPTSLPRNIRSKYKWDPHKTEKPVKKNSIEIQMAKAWKEFLSPLFFTWKQKLTNINRL